MTAIVDRPAQDEVLDDGEGSGSSWTRLLRPNVPAVVLFLAFVTWVYSLSHLNDATQNQYGLLFTATPLFAGSMVLTVIGFCLAIRAGRFYAAWFGVIMSVLILRLTFTLATVVPYYSWTYKHLGVVNWLQRSNGVPARDVDIYNHWVALFTGTAWFGDLTGMDPKTLAHWFTPVAYLLEVFLLYAFARAWDMTKMSALILTFVAETVDWIGQGYYSPQWTAFLMALGVLTLVGYSRKHPRYLWLVLFLFAVITIVHQLTPYWLIGAICGMAIFRKIKPWWLFLAMSAIALGFLIYNFGSASQFGLIHLSASNVDTNVPTTGSPGQQFTSMAMRVLCAGFWVSAFAVGIYRLVKRQPVMAQACLAFASFGLLAGQGYGGEAVFRVFLYSIPGCMLLLAGPMEHVLTRRIRRSRFSVVSLIAILCVAMLASGQGLFGNWFAYRMTREQVALAECLQNTAAIPSYITPAAPVWPERSTGEYVNDYRGNKNYDQLAVYATDLIGAHLNTDAQYARITGLIAARGAVPTYLIISQQMIFYDWYFGILPIDALYNLEARMIEDPKWEVLYKSSGVMIFKSDFFPTANAAPDTALQCFSGKHS